jgi:LytS/YehU family sensor histidine kinase
MSNIKTLEPTIHIAIWIVLFLFPAIFIFNEDGSGEDLFTHFWLPLILTATVFYLNYFFWVEKWFLSKKKMLFVIANFLLIFLFVYLKFEITSWFIIPHDHSRKGGSPPEALKYYVDILMFIAPVIFAIAVQSGKRMVHIELMKKENEMIRLQSELQYLRYQLQPHFFFNSLNTIYSTVDSSPEEAKRAVHSLGKLMRYLLQKSDQATVTLSEEVDFLAKYIELMTLRLTDKTTVQTDFPPILPNVRLSPLLFISIVENAFKHGVSATQPSRISFILECSESEIYFTAENTSFPKKQTISNRTGTGIMNLKKRLALLYPGRHSFTTEMEGDNFNATIIIPLETSKIL